MTNFIDVLKDIKDIQSVAGQGTLSGMLAAHEKMAERHRQISMVESLNALASQEANAARLAKAAQEQADRESRRVSSLPKCPSCHTPIERGKPEVCARCTRPMYWYLETPFTAKQAAALCSSMQPDDVMKSLSLRIELAREAASSSIYGFGLESIAIRELESNGLAFVSDPEKLGALDRAFHNPPAFHLARAAALCGIINKLVDSLNSHVAYMKKFMQDVAESTNATFGPFGDEIAKAIHRAESYRPVYDKPFHEWLPSPLGRQSFGAALLLMMLQLDDFLEKDVISRMSWTFLFVVEGVSDRSPPPPAKTKTGWFGSRKAVPADNTFHSIRGKLFCGKMEAGSWSSPIKYLVRADSTSFGFNRISAVAKDGETVKNLSAGQRAFDGHFTDVSQMLPIPTSGSFTVEGNVRVNDETVSMGLPRSYQFQEGDCVVFWRPIYGKGASGERNENPGRYIPQGEEVGAALNISKGIAADYRRIDGLPTEMMDLAFNAKEFLVDICMRAMCLAAAVDNRLRDAEMRYIVDAMIRRQVDIDPKEIKERVIATCKELARAGYASSAKALVEELRPFKGHPIVNFVRELMEDVSSADGSRGSREDKVLDYFTNELCVIVCSD